MTMQALLPFIEGLGLTTDVRLSCEALCACHAADHAAWVANGSPTDGTRNRLQVATREAVLEAERDFACMASADGMPVQQRAKILDELQGLMTRLRRQPTSG
jgi:hypothetical protein